MTDQTGQVAAPPPPPSQSARTRLVVERAIILVLVAGLLAGVVQILRPFATAILFGGALAVAVWPLRMALVRTGIRRGLCAALLLFASLVLIVGPVLALAPSLTRQVTQGLHLAHEFLIAHPPAPAWLERVPLVGHDLTALWSRAAGGRSELRELLAPYAEAISTLVISAVQALSASAVQLLLSLIVATMLWTSGDKLAATLRDVLLRLAGAPATRALDAVAGAVRGVAYGVVGTAALQGALMAVGLVIAGVPGAALLGFLTMLLSISQIGAVLILLVWGGAAWWLFGIGEPGWGIFMIAWGLVVNTSDNFIRPWLISFGVEMPIALVILGVFGGFIAFGFLGLFIGPSLLAIAYTLLEAWRRGPAAAQ
jgi:predicted PurR-regulated permease PerM